MKRLHAFEIPELSIALLADHNIMFAFVMGNFSSTTLQKYRYSNLPLAFISRTPFINSDCHFSSGEYRGSFNKDIYYCIYAHLHILT